jgi:hypothetical protein
MRRTLEGGGEKRNEFNQPVGVFVLRRGKKVGVVRFGVDDEGEDGKFVKACFAVGEFEVKDRDLIFGADEFVVVSGDGRIGCDY